MFAGGCEWCEDISNYAWSHDLCQRDEWYRIQTVL